MMSVPAIGRTIRNLFIAIKESEIIKRHAPKVINGESPKKPQDNIPIIVMTRIYKLTGINKLSRLGERTDSIMTEKIIMILTINLCSLIDDLFDNNPIE